MTCRIYAKFGKNMEARSFFFNPKEGKSTSKWRNICVSFKVNNFMSIKSRVEKSKSEMLESVLSGWKDSGGPRSVG